MDRNRGNVYRRPHWNQQRGGMGGLGDFNPHSRNESGLGREVDKTKVEEVGTEDFRSDPFNGKVLTNK